MKKINEYLETKALAVHTNRAKSSVEKAVSAFNTVLGQLRQAEVDGNASADELQRSAKAQVEASAICRAEADKAGRVGRRIQELLEA